MPEATSSPEVKSSRLKSFLRFLALVVVAVVVYLASAVATGFVSAFSNNIEAGTFSIIFDSQITIAYILMYYSLAHFYKFSERQNYIMFVSTLILSFTTNFIQGAFTLLILPPLLKKFKLIQSSS